MLYQNQPEYWREETWLTCSLKKFSYLYGQPKAIRVWDAGRPLKYCRLCSTYHCVSEFPFASPSRPRPDGLQDYCLKARRAKEKQWRGEHPEKINHWARQKRRNNPVAAIFHGAKSRAQRKRLFFDLTLLDIQNVWPANNVCPALRKKMVPGSRYAPTLDRIDSSKGYIVGNIQIISKAANRAKNDLTRKEQANIANWLLSFGS